MNQAPFHKPTVVITGGTAGIGRATVREFAKKGAKIGIIARGKKRLEQTQKEVEELGSKAAIASADVSDYSALSQAVDGIEEQLGPIDIWINNAMVTVFSPFKDITPEEFERVTHVTYLGFVWGTKIALKKMRRRNQGKIVQVGSAVAYRGIPLQSAYSGAKHAIQGFTEAVRTEVMHEDLDISITMVQLPAHNTPQFEWGRAKIKKKPQPVPPIYQPELAAKAIYYAAYSQKREVVLTTTALKAIWGNRLAPGIAAKILAKSGYKSQMSREDLEPERVDNLFQPVPGDYAARGRFNKRSRSFSIQFWLEKHKRTVAAIVGGIGMAAGMAYFLSQGEEEE